MDLLTTVYIVYVQYNAMERICQGGGEREGG
jgi:hypothetical protein